MLVYADDILLLATVVHSKMICRILQAAVNAVAKWTNNVGFESSVIKCARLHICNSNYQSPKKPITVNSTYCHAKQENR